MLPLAEAEVLPAPLVSRSFASPIGELTLVASDKGLRELVLHGGVSRALLKSRASANLVPDVDLSPQADRHLNESCEQLDQYFEGTRRGFSLDLDPQGTPFQMRAWAFLRTIPFGQTASYGSQARAVGDAKMARAVGAANGRNPIAIVLPCHRVISATGALTGFAGGLPVKAWLLEHERGVLC